MSRHTVAIVGRPNVGKSTLFNRLIGDHRQSIVDDESGVTRDRLYGVTEWNGKQFNLIDTGGFVLNSEDVFEAAIREQVLIAIEEATLILFITDATTGITDLDDQVAQLLRKSNKSVVLAVNKVDNAYRTYEANEFYSMGFEETFFIASISGSGSGELLDRVVELLPDDQEETEEEDIPKIAIVGQPNVGKSTLLNALTGQQRNIVTDIAGTTRDAIHTRYNMFQKDFLLIDTAGLRKKAKVHENLEFYSVIRAIKAIDEADVCMLMIDAQTGVEAQDLSILRLIENKHKGVLILVNKWDAIEKSTNTAKEMEAEIRKRIAPFTDIPILFISAMEKQRIFKSIELILDIYERRQGRIKTSVLNDWMQEVVEAYPPPSVRGRYIKIKYVTQLPVAYPAFAFFCNYPDHVRPHYRQYLENRLRESFDFQGVPISIYFRQK